MYLLGLHRHVGLLSVSSSRFARSASKQSDEQNECGTPSLYLRLALTIRRPQLRELSYEENGLSPPQRAAGEENVDQQRPVCVKINDFVVPLLLFCHPPGWILRFLDRTQHQNRHFPAS